MERYAGKYDGQQYVGIDLHRRSSVVVRTADTSALLEAVQIANSPLALAEVMTQAGARTDRAGMVAWWPRGSCGGIALRRVR